MDEPIDLRQLRADVDRLLSTSDAWAESEDVRAAEGFRAADLRRERLVGLISFDEQLARTRARLGEALAAGEKGDTEQSLRLTIEAFIDLLDVLRRRFQLTLEEHAVRGRGAASPPGSGPAPSDAGRERGPGLPG